MSKKIPKERPITTSINITQSLIAKLNLKAAELEFSSRNSLINYILTDWINKNTTEKELA